MPHHLKRGVDASAIKAADAKVREMVEQILADVDALARPDRTLSTWRQVAIKVVSKTTLNEQKVCESGAGSLPQV